MAIEDLKEILEPVSYSISGSIVVDCLGCGVGEIRDGRININYGCNYSIDNMIRFKESLDANEIDYLEEGQDIAKGYLENLICAKTSLLSRL